MTSSQPSRVVRSKQIVGIYKTRMQIEEGFRDCKSVHYGLCLSQHRRMNRQRRSVLCLIAACAIFILWCIGVAGTQTAIARQVRVNSSSKRTSYSTIFLARLLLAQSHFRLSNKAILNALSHINIYMESILCKWDLWGYLSTSGTDHVLLISHILKADLQVPNFNDSERVCGEFQFMQQWVSENDLCNGYCQLKSNWADFQLRACNLNADKSMSYKFGTDKLTFQVEKIPEILDSLDHDTFPRRKGTHSK